MKRILGILAVTCVVALVPGCAGESDHAGQDDDDSAHAESPASAPAAGPTEAVASIADTAGGELSGEARFTLVDGQVTLVVNIQNAPPGDHAFHIHENGNCGDGGKAAGSHWNPTAVDHGKWGHDAFHLGDLGNIPVGEDGQGSLTLTTDLWTIGSGADNDIMSKAVILHETLDDFTSQPTGNAGGRIGCGVIE